MTVKSIYKTRQRELLLQYLKERNGVHITAGDVCEYFKQQGITIGQSTIYRQLERMVDEGLVSKYLIDGSSPACFEYTGHGSLSECEECYHCKCEKCGKLIHLHCEELAGLCDHLLSHHHFQVNHRRTVFYGICEDCRKKGAI